MTSIEDKEAVPYSRVDDSLPDTPLSREYYTSQEWYERDLERVFFKRWLFAGHSTQVAAPGQFFTFELGAESVIVSRTSAGELKAFYNVCRHRGARVCQVREGKARNFRCGFHGWSYGLDGSLKLAPYMPEDLDKSQFPLRPVWLEEWNGMIFLALSQERPEPVAVALANADFSKFQLPKTKVVADRTYEVEANWKIAAETFAECYHCAIIHPDFVKITDVLGDLEAWDDASGGAGGDYVIFTPDLAPAMVEGAVTLSADGQFLCQRRLGSTDNPPSENAAVSWFPQWGMFVQPDYATTFSWTPTGPTTTLFRSTWLVHEDAVEGVDYETEKLIHFMDHINEEDKDITRIAQLGVNSKAYDNSAPYHRVLEGPVRGFLRTYFDYVQDPDR